MVKFKFGNRDRKDIRNSRGGNRNMSGTDFRRERSGGGFRGRRSGGGFRRDSGRPSDRRLRRKVDMHDIICDKCGKESQVPFKPSSDKPVLCSECFGNKSSGDGFASRNQSRQTRPSQTRFSEQLNKIEVKLDKIIKALEIKSKESD